MTPNAESMDQIALLLKAGLDFEEAVDGAIAATNFEQLIASANKGDRAAAKELLALASAYLGSDIFGPMPPRLRRYLAQAFAAMSIEKNCLSADVALNLKANGRPPREQRTRLRIGRLIQKRMADGETLEDSCMWLADHIHAGLKQHEVFYGFKEIPDWKTLEGIYTEALPELRGYFDLGKGQGLSR